MLLKPNTIMVLGGMIILGILGIITTKIYESNPDEVETLSPWFGIPIVLGLTYIYIDNFSYLTYIISIGAVILLFV